jgi:hypothetical protein
MGEGKMKRQKFNDGDRVRYIGTRSPWLFGLYGIVEATGHEYDGMIELKFSGGDGETGYYGCYTENLELVAPREPDWEV